MKEINNGNSSKKKKDFNTSPNHSDLSVTMATGNPIKPYILWGNNALVNGN